MKESADLKIIGKFPQLEKMFDGFHAHFRYEAWGLFNSRSPIPMKKVTGFELKHHARLTDWISFVHVGFGAALISEKLYNLFTSFRPMPFICVDAEVNHRNKSYPYKFLYFTHSFDSFIDFKKSRFYIGFTNKLERDVSIDSFDILQMHKDNLEGIKQKTGVTNRVKILDLFIDEKAVSLDLFKFEFHANYIITARLKEAMEQAGITGLCFEPAQGHKYLVWDHLGNPPRQVV